MSRGPSPVIPLLLVGALGWVIFGPQLLDGWSLLTKFQEARFTPLIIIPIIAFLLVFLNNGITSVLQVIVLVALLFKVMVIAPLLLLVTAIFSSTYLSSNQNNMLGDGPRYYDKNDGEGWFSFGLFMIVMLFLALNSLYCEGECNWWISLMLLLPFVYFFSTS